MPSSYSPPLAVDRAGPGGGPPVVLVHAGVADRRMWNPQWPGLTREYDAVRLDLRGYGESIAPPHGPLRAVDDVLETLDALGIERCHLVGASYGAGVAVEVALSRPGVVASLLLSAPGGSLIAEATPDLRAFFDAERAALTAGNLDAAVEANLTAWVDGPRRDSRAVDARMRGLVAQMQRRAFEVTANWGDVEEQELEPPALGRLGEIEAPTRVLAGRFDIDAIRDTAHRVTDGIPGASLVEWDTAHLPSLERPDDFSALLADWLGSAAGSGRG